MSAPNENVVVVETQDGVRTLRMNNPRKLNAWTMTMLETLREQMQRAADDDDVGAIILTGTDPYYCAGVNLSSVITLDHPAKLHAFIVEKNEELFDLFLSYPKPIMVAVNGPAIGASVTSLLLCDGVIASEEATFSTPFAKLGVTPEGCSSVTFPKILGQRAAERMLYEEGWQPTGSEAAEIGLVDRVVAHDALLDEAQKVARGWVEADRGREIRAGLPIDELRKINRRESEELAYAFLGTEFLRGQFEFLWSREKYGPALIFFALLVTRPFWSQFLPSTRAQ